MMDVELAKRLYPIAYDTAARRLDVPLGQLSALAV